MDRLPEEESHRPRRVRLSLVIFSVCLLFTVMLWDFYFNSSEPINQVIAANLILSMGILFSVAAGLFAWSIESRHDFLEREIRRKTEQLHVKNQEGKKAEIASAAIYQSSHLLFSEVSVNHILHTVMDLMTKVMLADEGSIMLKNVKNELYIAASRGLKQDLEQQVHLRMGERVAGRAAKEKREFLLVDGLDKYPEFRGIEPNARIRSSIVCPLICQGEVLGVLNMNRTVNTENFTVADLLNVSIFAAQVAQALRNASLYENLKAMIDELQTVNQRMRELESHIR
jgi:transcriptional regulator with GAF, ATPase, and Fis domain